MLFVFAYVGPFTLDDEATSFLIVIKLMRKPLGLKSLPEIQWL